MNTTIDELAIDELLAEHSIGEVKHEIATASNRDFAMGEIVSFKKLPPETLKAVMEDAKRVFDKQQVAVANTDLSTSHKENVITLYKENIPVSRICTMVQLNESILQEWIDEYEEEKSKKARAGEESHFMKQVLAGLDVDNVVVAKTKDVAVSDDDVSRLARKLDKYLNG